MTLEQLNAHLELVVKLQAAEETLERLETSASGPNGQNLTGMPSAHNAGDKVGKLVTELDYMRHRVARLRAKTQESAVPIIEWVSKIDDIEVWRVFYQRFILGKPWKEVADTMGQYISEDKVQHICYRYLNLEPQQNDFGG